ncbi:P2-like prophage tail protein X [Cohnella sp. OV330]|nr:tail protein X [Cohnella sp. OV330]SFA91506.1 P2-like prophage tail protein X [Cohnella sp. OV330]
MTTYRTVQGDTWDAIAYAVYGREYLMPLLLDANPDYSRVVVFGAGVLLNVPGAPDEAAAGLPPWKREG